MKRNAFTLIELLVVIAIIAILASILFPVFAQAKEMAKKSKSLAQLDQIGTASLMYTNDNDDSFPSIYDGNPCGGDPICTMNPYIMSPQIWFVNRTPDAGGTPYFNSFNDYNDLDFGYNWGYEIRSAGGMINGEQCADGGDVVNCNSRGYPRYNSGKNSSQMTNPAGLFQFGDTYDTPRQTIGGDGWILDGYNGAEHNMATRYSGNFNEVYADGHANSLPWKFGNLPGYGFHHDHVASPKDFNARVAGYCADPNEIINPFPRLGYPLSPMKCSDWVAFPEAAGVQWWPD